MFTLTADTSAETFLVNLTNGRVSTASALSRMKYLRLFRGR